MAEVLDAKWWSPKTHAAVVGAVAVESYKPEGTWKVYVGIGFGLDEKRDAELIAQTGSPLGSKELAIALFPQLAAEKFRY